MRALSLVGLRNGKQAIRWGVLLARVAVYLVMFGAIVSVVTWISDVVFKRNDVASVARLVSLPAVLTILFVVHDLRRDLKQPSSDLPDLDRGTGSELE